MSRGAWRCKAALLACAAAAACAGPAPAWSADVRAPAAAASRPAAVAPVAVVPAAAPPEAVAHRDLMFAALGDMPYGDDLASGQAYRALIALVNAERPAFTVHVGDFKSGLAPCTDAEYQRQAAYFKRFEQPLIYTPGDNDWRDCHRRGGDPLERLAALRRLFFADGGGLGLAPITVTRQADLMPEHRQMAENLRWHHSGVAFASLHTVGPDNGLDSGAQAWRAEARARDAANAEWIRAAFDWAQARQARALVLITQAAVLSRLSGQPPRWAVTAAFQRSIEHTLVPLASAATFPVLLIHGDHHSFKFDQPFTQANGRPVRQLWRLEVPGDPRIHAVRVMVPAALPPGRPPFLVAPIWNPQSPDPRMVGR